MTRPLSRVVPVFESQDDYGNTEGNGCNADPFDHIVYRSAVGSTTYPISIGPLSFIKA